MPLQTQSVSLRGVIQDLARCSNNRQHDCGAREAGAEHRIKQPASGATASRGCPSDRHGASCGDFPVSSTATPARAQPHAAGMMQRLKMGARVCCVSVWHEKRAMIQGVPLCVAMYRPPTSRGQRRTRAPSCHSHTRKRGLSEGTIAVLFAGSAPASALLALPAPDFCSRAARFSSAVSISVRSCGNKAINGIFV